MKKGKAGSRLDDFVQMGVTALVESAAGTLTFSPKVDTGYSLGNDNGLIIHTAEWFFPRASIDRLLDEADYIRTGMSTSTLITTIDPSNPSIIVHREFALQKFGVAASGFPLRSPQLEADFTNLPGGGILVAPNPLYWYIQGISMAGVIATVIRWTYTVVNLNDKSFRELWETWNQLRG